MKSNFFPKVIKMAVTSATLLLGTQVNAQWGTVGTAGFVPGGNGFDHIFIDSANVPYISFTNAHGQVMKYTDTGWAAVGGTDITTGTASDSWSAMAPNGDIYFSYADVDSFSEAAVLKYDGGSWTSIGSRLSVDTATVTNIVVASDGTPYMSYLDSATSHGPAILYVKKYDGSSWTMVGGAEVTRGAASPCLAIDDNDTLYVAYQDASGTQNVIVDKFDGTNWTMVGSGPFCAHSTGGAYFLSLAIDHKGLPYVAYMSPVPSGPSICVSQFDGSSWNTLGSASFTPVPSEFTSIAIDHNNNPYVLYADMSGTGASVMKYDGSSWNYVGSAGLSAGTIVYPTMAIDGNNNPYIGYLDAVNSGGTTVQKYTLCTPSDKATVTVSDTLICKGSSVTLSASGTLNDAKKWYWYSGSPKGKAVDSGSSVTLMPGDTTTYYVRGGGGCVLSSASSMATVDVDSVAKPNISVASSVLTSSAGSGNQWYENGTAISGATSNSYTATTSGWYKVEVTNSNHCSSMSDSVFVTGLGVAQISNDANINVYPSPFTETVHIDFLNSQYNAAGTVVYITDNMGRKVFEQKGLEQKNTISLTVLPSGIYFINLVTSENSEVLRVVKQ